MVEPLMRLRLPIAILLAGAALAAPPALAQPKPPPADAPKPPPADAPKPPPPPSKADEARLEAQRVLAKQAEARTTELVKRGKEACANGDHEEGITALTAVWTQKGDIEVGAALGACEAAAGRFPAAAEHLAAVLRVKEDGAERKKIEEMFLDVRKRVGAVKVAVNIEGADVIVGNRLVGQSPLPGEVYVEANKRTLIIAKKPGHEEAEKTVQLAPQGTAEITLKMAPATMVSNRYAADARSKIPFVVLGGLALVAGGVGASFYAAAGAKSSAADDMLAELKKSSGQKYACSPTQTGCATVSDLRASRDMMMNVGTGVLIGSGVLLGAAVLAGAWAYSGGTTASGAAPAVTRTARISVTPSVSTDGGGLWLQGAF